MIFLEEQLDFIRYLQEWRGPIFDSIARFLNFFDTSAYYSALVSFIWVGISWRWGVRLGFLLMVNGIVNTTAKLLFALPRPFYFDPSLALVKVGGYGFPSGGAQTAMLFGVLLLHYWKSRWAWPAALCYIAVISLSRVVLGVHFPADVLGGWVLGLLVAALFIAPLRSLEAFVSKHSAPIFYTIIALALALLVFSSSTLRFIASVAIASSLGIYISTKCGLYLSDKRGWGKKVFHGLIAVGGAALLAKGAGHLAPPSWSRDFLIQGIAGALWVTLLASPFCKKLS